MMTTTNETKRAGDIRATIDAARRMLTLTYGDGGVMVCDADRLTADMFTMCAMHGLKQKLVDAAAISRDPETGRKATVATKRAAVEAVWERLLTGTWNAARGEGGSARGGLLFRALCRAYPTKAPDEVRAYLAGKSDAEQSALRRVPRIAAIIEEIRAEDAADDTIDGDALLAGWEG